MSDIERIRQEIERRKGYISVTHFAEELLAFIDSLPEDASCVYDTNKLTPTPSVNIEDVARVQFASHVKVFDRKRKAVFDWEQFKEVASIFYGFGKKNSLPEEKPSEDLEKAAEKFAVLYDQGTCDGIAQDCFIAGAKWQKAIDEKILDAITADAHGRKVKDIHIDPYSENGEIKVAVMFEEEEQRTDLPRYYGD